VRLTAVKIVSLAVASGVLVCAVAISACGLGGSADAAGPACPTAAFQVSLVSAIGGEPTPLAAARWFARHGGVAHVPASGWQLAREDGGAATVRSGLVTLHVIEGPDGTWQVDGGSTCT
jgi:hypothetical protein